MSECKNCDCQSGDSGFIFGMVIGAVIGAVVAILIYKNNKTEVFSDLKGKLEKYFKNFISSTETKLTKKYSKPEKLPVILPSKIVKESAPVKTIFVKPRKFVKP